MPLLYHFSFVRCSCCNVRELFFDITVCMRIATSHARVTHPAYIYTYMVEDYKYCEIEIFHLRLSLREIAFLSNYMCTFQTCILANDILQITKQNCSDVYNKNTRVYNKNTRVYRISLSQFSLKLDLPRLPCT